MEIWFARLQLFILKKMTFKKYHSIAKKLEPEIFDRLKSAKRNDRYLYVSGKMGYWFVAKFYSRKSTPNRVGRFEPLFDIIFDSILEYCCIGKQPPETLNFEVLNYEQVSKIIPNITPATRCSYDRSFFKVLDKIEK